MTKHKPCLVLNQDYTPLTVISWKRAICLEIIGKEMPGEGITILNHYKDDQVFSAGGQPFEVPAVAVTGRYIKRRRKVKLRKRNLFIRDQGMCQYCSSKLNLKVATIDHVKPKSHFKDSRKSHTWENTVIACSKCNSKKGNRTPEQAGMKLLGKPKEPDAGHFYGYFSTYSTIPEEWRIYVRV